MLSSLLLASAPLLAHAAVAGRNSCQKDLCYLEVEVLPLAGWKSECSAALATTVTTTITQTPSPISSIGLPSSVFTSEPIITSSALPTSFSNSTITISSLSSSALPTPTIVTSCTLSSTVGANTITTSEYVGYPFIPWFSHWTTFTTLSDYTSVATLCATTTESAGAASLTTSNFVSATPTPVLPSPSLPAASSCSTGVVTKIVPGKPILETISVPGRHQALTLTVPNPVPSHTVITTTNCNVVPSLPTHSFAHPSPCIPQLEILTIATSVPTMIPFGGRAIGSFESIIESFIHVTKTLSACHGAAQTSTAAATSSPALPSTLSSSAAPTPQVTTICHAHIALSTSLSTTTIKVPGIGPFVKGVTHTFTIPHVAPVTTTSCAVETLALEPRFLHVKSSSLSIPTHHVAIPTSLAVPTSHLAVPTHSLAVPHISIPIPTSHLAVPTHIPGAGALNFPSIAPQYGVCGSQSKFASACACLGHTGATVTVTAMATASAGF